MATDPHNLVGKTLLDRFSVDAPLGQGGMGAVFVATQLSLGRKIALKVMKSVDAGEEAVKRFQRETKVIAQLQHPNIVQVVDAGQGEDGTLFLAMELLAGETLRALLRREGPLPVARVLSFAEDIASALVAAHAAGVIHRDLKPENVMVVRPPGRAEVCKVLDFGVAKLTSQEAGEQVTGSGFVAGTPGAIAPEQMMGKSEDPRSDLYALGVTMFELLCGRPPFQGGTTVELLMRHMTEPAPRVAAAANALRLEVPPAVDDLVAALLAKKPEERPASASALVETLRALREGVTPTMSSTPKPVPRPDVVATAPTTVVDLPPDDPTGDEDLLPAKKIAAEQHTMPTPLAGSVSATQRRRLPRVALASVLVVVAGVLSVGAFEWMKLDALARTALGQQTMVSAVSDFWQLDFERARAKLNAVIVDDDAAPVAHLTMATMAAMDGAPLAVVDDHIARAQAAAAATVDEHTRRSLAALTVLSPDEAIRRFDEHFQGNDGCWALEPQIMAVRLLTADRYDKILEYLYATQALHHDRWFDKPLMPATRYALAYTYTIGLGQPDKALELLEPLPPAVDARPIVQLLRAEIARTQHGDDAARAILEKVDHPRAKIALVRVSEPKDVVGAIDAARAAIDKEGERGRRSALLAELGHAAAGEGMLARANALWGEAVKLVDDDDARVLEIAVMAQSFSVFLRDYENLIEWRKVDDERIDRMAAPDLSTARIKGFRLGMRVLAGVATKDRNAQKDLDALLRLGIDVPLLVRSVAWRAKAMEGKWDEALAAAGPDDCFSYAARASIHLRALAQDPGARAANLDDAWRAVAPVWERGPGICVARDAIHAGMSQVAVASLYEMAAEISILQGQPARAREALARLRDHWPSADASVPTRCIADALERCLESGGACETSKALPPDLIAKCGRIPAKAN